jgi:outer membrane protein
MKKIIAISALVCILAIPKGYGQAESYFSLQYPISFATGDLADYISQVSFRGMAFEFRIGITDNIMAGADVAWNVFYERKPFDTYTAGTETVSGVQFRYQNEVPLMASLEYLFMVENELNPYIGMGIGTMYTERATDMGLYRLLENPWHFAIKPEVGILYELNYQTAVKLAAKYYMGFASGDLETQGYISLCAGLSIYF